MLADAALVGIYTRGVVLAQRLRRLIAEISGVDAAGRRARHHVLPGRRRAPRRRDAARISQPIVKASRLDFPLDGRSVIVVDDVLYTGRTVRAAIEALFDYGRPARVRLAVLCDRGHRELPFRADFVGKNLPTSRSERVARAADRGRRGRGCPARRGRGLMDDALRAMTPPPPRRHLLSSDDLDAARCRAVARSRRELRGGR